ncbi:DUF2306 domain-containing protein [Jeongeupia naejangsanensis]|uniref:DUF2306 domain-containing protein n=1 Tax=Jeongeupia naejangsanensis TaxID=613195 RepID=A0ABS2BQ62_9NEIS|nr:DUF2306 domain-containing protein [Jeongeupia naejangsanensis]MBM3117772.1 DUF2306 domain-containing protein [Jeongeupia naejangsanensis]
MSAILTPIGGLHLATASWAMLAGGVQLALPKGGDRHRWLGRSWVLAMLVVALSSFGLGAAPGRVVGFGPIHLLSLWVLWCLWAAIVRVRAGHIAAHRRYVIGAYIGTVVAGLFAVFGPDRWLHHTLFAL